MRQDGRGPVGLGGWLWPVTWLSAMMPVLFFTLVVHWVLDIVAGYPATLWEYSAEFRWDVYSGIVSTSVGLCVTVWWAMHWFARSPRLVTWGAPVLTACMVLTSVLLWPERDEPTVMIVVATGWSMAAIAWWAARRSVRVRDAFTTPPGTLTVSGMRGMLLGGPSNWAALRWLLPGVLGYTAVNLWLDLQISVGAATEPLPEGPPPTNVFAAIGDPTRYILASREAAALQAAAALSLLGALVALARGSRWLPLWTVVAVLLALGAAVRMAIRDWCCPFLDGPEFERASHAWMAVLALTIIGAIAWRRPRATPHAE